MTSTMMNISSIQKIVPTSGLTSSISFCFNFQANPHGSANRRPVRVFLL
jgi:hypothetical protein